MTFRPSTLNLYYIIPLCLVLVGIPILFEYITTSYVLSNGIFEERKGFLFKKSRAIPVANIDNIKVEYFAFFKGIGKITIETPGEGLNEISTKFWISNPDYLRNLLIG